MNHIIKHNTINLHIGKIQPDHMDKISDMIAEYSGILISRLLPKHVIREIAAQMEKYAVNDPEEYISILKTKDGYTFVMDDLISAISVSESYFFRNLSQFEYLYREFFPQFYAKKSNYNKKITIWSAGCSRGEEPYSAAIIADLFFKSNPISSFKIYAGDISNSNLEAAKSGKYTPRSIRKDFNGFEKVFGEAPCLYKKNEQFIIPKSIYSYVKFQNLNLKQNKDLKKLKESDIIMCRNVLIYFDDELVKNLMEVFYESLNPEGILLLGETEILPKDFSRFHRINYKNTFIYKKTL